MACWLQQAGYAAALAEFPCMGCVNSSAAWLVTSHNASITYKCFVAQLSPMSMFLHSAFFPLLNLTATCGPDEQAAFNKYSGTYSPHGFCFRGVLHRKSPTATWETEQLGVRQYADCPAEPYLKPYFQKMKLSQQPEGNHSGDGGLNLETHL